MRSPEEVDQVLRLFADGHNKCAIARITGIPRRTVGHWLAGRIPDFEGHRTGQIGRSRYPCPICAQEPEQLPREEYVYLLGLYLGDGCVYKMSKGVFRLGIFCADVYPDLMRGCEVAMAAVLPTKVGHRQKQGCVEVHSYSKHWPCLFPQHGPGVKHLRKIELADWQQELVDVDPRPLIRGLIHSDGCRVLNRASGTDYPPYPRYHFTNASADIRDIFTRACDAIGVEWRYNNKRNISVARRASVSKLDEFIGPKY